MLRRVTHVRTDVSEEGSIIRVTRIGELRTVAVTNRRTLRRNTEYIQYIYIVVYSISPQRASVVSYC
jgi:hypothetical protein